MTQFLAPIKGGAVGKKIYEHDLDIHLGAIKLYNFYNLSQTLFLSDKLSMALLLFMDGIMLLNFLMLVGTLGDLLNAPFLFARSFL